MTNTKYSDIIDQHGCQATELHHQELDGKTVWIRTETLQESSSSMMSQDEIHERIRVVEQEQGQYGRADLPQREWTKETAVVAEEDSDGCFTVMELNMLAEGLSFGPNAKAPFPATAAETTNNHRFYGGFDTVKHPDVCFDFELRKWRLLQAILEVDADVMGLAEMDRFHGFFEPLLKKQFGYEGMFVPKRYAAGIDYGYYSDGCAIFFRSSVFRLIDQKHFYYQVGNNQVCLVARLQHRATKRFVTIVMTHLKAKKEEAIRIQQVQELVTELLPDDNDDEPKIVLGDFNCEPSSDSIQRMSSVLTSAYNLDNTDQVVTTWKTRGVTSVKRIIDYIFYSSALLQLQATLKIPINDIQEEKLPSLRYPSDHILLAAKFAFQTR